MFVLQTSPAPSGNLLAMDLMLVGLILLSAAAVGGLLLHASRIEEPVDRWLLWTAAIEAGRRRREAS